MTKTEKKEMIIQGIIIFGILIFCLIGESILNHLIEFCYGISK